MRTLVLLRHAKAEQSAFGPDAERRLTARGHADSAAVGAWLAARGLRPSRVLCSPARRTRETWHGVRVALGGSDEADVVFDPALYDDGAREILTAIQQTAPEVAVLMVVGHNPTMSSLSGMLDADADTDLRTAGLAVHTVDGDWADVRPAEAPLTAAYTARGD